MCLRVEALASSCSSTWHCRSSAAFGVAGKTSAMCRHLLMNEWDSSNVHDLGRSSVMLSHSLAVQRSSTSESEDTSRYFVPMDCGSEHRPTPSTFCFVPHPTCQWGIADKASRRHLARGPRVDGGDPRGGGRTIPISAGRAARRLIQHGQAPMVRGCERPKSKGLSSLDLCVFALVVFKCAFVSTLTSLRCGA